MDDRVRELAAARRRFVVPALALFVVWFGTFLGLMGYAHQFMQTRVVGASTWAYVLALSIIVLVWAIAFAVPALRGEHAGAPRGGPAGAVTLSSRR